MAKRHFLMLAQKYNRGKHGVGGYYLSEKLDGMRCFWDGGISRGLFKSDVPWANCEKDERYNEPPIATGLWSRLGNVIHAPEGWLDKLPKMPLDGELYWHCDYKGDYLKHDKPRQDLMSLVKKIKPKMKWANVRFYVFDAPCLFTIFDEGQINVTNFKKTFTNIGQWLFKHAGDLDYLPKRDTQFVTSAQLLINKFQNYKGPVVVLPQKQLPHQTTLAQDTIDTQLDLVTSLGGEGLMLRKPESLWVPNRVHELLKIKKLDDGEGIVTGYITGRKTDKGSKLLGLMGAMILQINVDEQKVVNGSLVASLTHKRLELSGFTDYERMLGWCMDDDMPYNTAQAWAAEHPETECPPSIEANHFPRGTKITFRHRGKTKDGIPMEARYWRTHEDSS